MLKKNKITVFVLFEEKRKKNVFIKTDLIRSEGKLWKYWLAQHLGS